jgi:hypothetical protein
LLIGGFDFSNFFANGSFRWELGFNGVGGAIAGGFASGGIMGGNIESAVNGAFSAALFYGVGELSGAHEAAAAGRSMTGAEHLAQTFGHAVVGCVSASIAGGSCGSGAASAGFAAAAGPLLPGADISPERFFARVIVGGTASRLAGGSFANGATSAAFAYLFNDLGGRRNPEQGARAVAKVQELLTERGWTFLDAETRAEIPGLPERRYDLLMRDPEGNLFGIEVKSTIRATFKLDPKQVAFDALAVERGALMLSGPAASQVLRSVLYVGYGLEGARDATFATRVLQLTLQSRGIETRIAKEVGGVK